MNTKRCLSDRSSILNDFNKQLSQIQRQRCRHRPRSTVSTDRILQGDCVHCSDDAIELRCQLAFFCLHRSLKIGGQHHITLCGDNFGKRVEPFQELLHCVRAFHANFHQHAGVTCHRVNLLNFRPCRKPHQSIGFPPPGGVDMNECKEGLTRHFSVQRRHDGSNAARCFVTLHPLMNGGR